jgi:hypothetical protein
LGDEGPQGRIGGEDAVVTVTVDAGRGKDRGQAVQELESGKTKGSAAGGIGLWQDVENLVRATADQVEPFESEGRPGTIANEPLEPLSVGGLDTDAGVQAEPRRLSTIEDPFGVRRAHEPKASNPPP